MALRQTKKISELTALTSASLQTTLLGVDNGTTYKVTLDVLEDAIINMVSRSTDLRLDSLETYTASANVASDLTLLNSFTSSQNTLNSAFTTGINARLQTSSFNDFSASVHSEILSATNEQSFNGLISGSSQFTASYDERYVLSGSITQTTWDNIANKPSGIVSQSTDLSYLNTFTQSIDNRVDSLESWSSSLTDTFATDLEVSIVSSSVAATISIISQNTGLVNTSSFNSYTASISTASLVTSISNLNSATSSYEIKGSGILSGSVSYNDLTNIPSGIVSQSIDLSSLNTFTQSIDSRVDSLENATSSYLTSLSGAISSSSQLTSSYDSRYTLSGSVSAVPSGTISGSSQITGIVNLTNLSATSQISASVFVGGFGVAEAKYTVIQSKPMTFYPNPSIESVRFTTAGAVLIGGNHSENGFKLSVTGSARIIGLTNITGSLVVSDGVTGSIAATNGVISGSSQLTSSFDTRYTLSGSVTATPDGTISGSSQITTLGFATTSSFNSYTASISTASLVTSISNLNSATSSYLTSLSGVISGSSQLTSSYDTRYALSGSVGSSVNTSSLATTGSNSFNGNQTITGSLIVSAVAVVNGGVTIPTGSTITLTSGSSISVDASGAITGSLTGSVFGIGDVVAFSSSVNSRLNSAGGVAGTISSSAQITAFGFVSGSYETTGRGIISSSANLVTTSSFNSYTASISTASIVTSISNLNSATSSYLTSLNGAISGSSQLTSSYDTRYTLSGSVSAVPSGTISSSAQITAFGFVSSSTSVPAGTISGSSQLTSSFDGRYTQTGSFNTLTASFNSFTASAQSVTTGSNSFNGTQIITGSLIITTGSFVASQILANTASLYLTSGSNMYVQNNGVVEITGSLIVSGSTTLKVPVLYVGTGSSVEGGEIDLAYAQSGSTTLTGSAVVFDIWQDRVRIFENGGTNRGGYFDISTLAAGVGTDLGKLTYFIEAYANVSYTLPGSYTDDVCRYSVVSTNVNVPTAWFNTSTYTFTPLKAGYWEIIASYDVYRNGEASLLIKKNGTSVAGAGAISSVVQQVTKIIYLNGSTDYINVYNAGVNSNARTQSSSNAFFQARFVGA